MAERPTRRWVAIEWPRDPNSFTVRPERDSDPAGLARYTSEADAWNAVLGQLQLRLGSLRLARGYAKVRLRAAERGRAETRTPVRRPPRATAYA